jgi:SPP1 gp7 family putative phage head morphogenesis protein
MPPKNRNRIFNYTLTKRIEDQYGKDLYNVSREVDRIVSSFINKMDKGTDKVEIEDVGDLIDKLQEYSNKIQGWAEKTANKMVYSLEKEDVKQWQEHSKAMSILMKKELTESDMKKILEKYAQDNIKLITSLPIEAAQRVHDIVYNNLTTSKRANTVFAEIMKTGQVTKSRANLIARTETSKAATGLVMARSSSIGLDWLVWHSTGGVGGDGRTRLAHRKMDGVLMRWDDPPNPEKLFPSKGVKSYGNYLPGSTFNCRCWCFPIISLSDIQWPARVYMNNKIQLMNKKQFLEIADQEFYKRAV